MEKIKSEFDKFIDDKLIHMKVLPNQSSINDYVEGANAAWKYQEERLKNIKFILGKALETIRTMEHSYALEDINQKINEALFYAE